MQIFQIMFLALPGVRGDLLHLHFSHLYAAQLETLRQPQNLEKGYLKYTETSKFEVKKKNYSRKCTNDEILLN